LTAVAFGTTILAIFAILAAGIRVRLSLVIVALLGVCRIAAAQEVPLPHQRPATLDERFRGAPLTSVPMAAPTSLAPAPELRGIINPPRPGPLSCERRLAEIAVHTPLPAISGPGPCGARDAVRLEAIKLPGRPAVSVDPPATLRCALAEAVANWVRDDLAPAASALGSDLVAIANYDSYSCRGRNRVVGAKLSEHGRANALDVRALGLANGVAIEPTDPNTPKAFREAMRRSACARFTTVLGPGSDGYHENHVHIDLAERRGGYRICHWELRETPNVASIPLPLPRPLADRKPP
jgi:hypothetical protein